ncbi:unannotated protein [freshwater metagenome]|uniref:Unannotated protein n=1 Tax=freshwater metagenome TaxID=449393 RepID=A0A6J6F816_9ZZZZ
MLRGDNDGVHASRHLSVIPDGHLGFPIRTKIREDSSFTNMLKPFCQTVRVENRSGHKHGRFVTRVSKHQSLVSGAEFVAIVDRTAYLG